MLKTKRFDCVRMKWDIQQQILQEFKDVSPDQVREVRRRQIEGDPVLGALLQRVREACRKSSKS